MDTTTNITHDGLRARIGAPRRAYVLRPDGLPRALFAAEVLADGLAHIVQDSFRGEAGPARLSTLGTPVLVRTDTKGDEVEALLRLRNGVIALIDAGYGHVSIDAAASTPEVARRAAASLRRALETAPPVPNQISIAFWMRGDSGGDVRHREIEAPRFEDIAENYSASVREALGRLIERQSPAQGRLILWRGAPGTGKSHALRALARAWAPWCSAHFIMDPDELLGRGGGYMLDVLTWDS